MKDASFFVSRMEDIFRNKKSFLLITMMIIAVLQIDIFGVVGLAVYGLLIVYGVVFISLNFKKLNCLKHPIFYIACAYYIYFIFAEIINGNFTYTGPSIIQFFILTIVAFSLQSMDDIKSSFKTLSKFLTVMGLVVSISSILICLLVYYVPSFVLSLPEAIGEKLIDFAGAFPVRSNGVIGNANRSAGYLYISALFSLYLIVSYRERRWFVPAVFNIGIAFFSTFIIFTARTYMLCLLITLPGFFVAYLLSKYRSKIFKQKFFYIIISLVLLIILCFILMCVFSDEAKNYILNHIVRVSSLHDGTGRLGIFRASLELSKENKLFGYYYKELYNVVGQNHAHNNFLEVLASGGIPTFVLFCLFMFYTIYVAIKNIFISKSISTETRLLICLLISYLVGYTITGMTGSDINRMMYTTVILPSVMGATHIIQYHKKNGTLS